MTDTLLSTGTRTLEAQRPEPNICGMPPESEGTTAALPHNHLAPNNIHLGQRKFIVVEIPLSGTKFKFRRGLSSRRRHNRMPHDVAKMRCALCDRPYKITTPVYYLIIANSFCKGLQSAY